MQNEESTYVTIEPTAADAFEAWRQATNFDVETHKGDIAQLLIAAPTVRGFHARLIPAKTSYSDFWARYYFRVHQIEEDEARRTQLIRRANEICSETSESAEQSREHDWDEPGRVTHLTIPIFTLTNATEFDGSSDATATVPEPIVEQHEPTTPPVQVEEEASNEHKESDTRKRISTRRT